MPQDYPIPRYHFQVDWGGVKISFTEVTGLVMEREKIEPCGGWYPSEVPGVVVTEVAAHDAALQHDPKQVATWIADIVQG